MTAQAKHALQTPPTETQGDTPPEGRSGKRRVRLSQLLWIGVAALAFFPIEAMLFMLLEPRSTLWGLPLAALGWLGVFVLLYCFIENLKRCASPLRFILWLLAGGIAVSLITLGLNWMLGVVLPTNYAFEFYYILLFVLCVNSLVAWRNDGFSKRTLLFPAMLALTIGLHYACRHLAGLVLQSAADPSAHWVQAAGTFFSVLIFPASSLRMLAPLACLWFYARKKRTQCWALVAYCLFVWLVHSAQFSDMLFIHNLFNNVIPWLLGGTIAESTQFFGIVAIPLIWCYDGAQGEALRLKRHGFLLLLYPVLAYVLYALPSWLRPLP